MSLWNNKERNQPGSSETTILYISFAFLCIYKRNGPTFRVYTVYAQVYHRQHLCQGIYYVDKGAKR
jgi:hypothetical protein